MVLACPVPGESEGDDPYRPVAHFAPAQHWVNDPNGPVWYEGRYHLFFQHNPAGDVWGSISWGHAVSDDLVHWEELPVAIPATDDELVFSGTVVVDHGNTSGLGVDGRDPLVAVYTSYDPTTHVQAQSLASSTDGGTTWTRYPGNPVLDVGSREFRDPKVLWYADGGYWVMLVVLATEHVVQLYRSDDLRSWTHLSDFGPAHAVGGVWEMPDLVELPVDGDPDRTRWVLVVSLNPGSPTGGSGTQYFVGDFDGTTFTPDDLRDDDDVPAGDVVAAFEGPTYGDGWETTGSAFGSGPVAGALPGQHPVSGFVGERVVNSFLGGDRPVGTLTSPPFRITRSHLALLVGGGDAPRVPGTGDGGAPPGTVLGDFEGDGFAGWTASGTAFGDGPTRGDAPCQDGVTGYLGTGLASSYRNGTSGDPCVPVPDTGTGTLTSPPFTIDADHVSFLVGGGPHPDTAVRLVVDGQVVRSTSGPQSGTLDWASWDVSDLRGREARVEIVDASTDGWGHVLADHVVLGDEPALPRGAAASVDLLVDGQVVRSATGTGSEALDWVSWDVRDLVGRDARLRVVDSATGPWGHVLLDHVVATDAAVPRRLERYDWMDHGSDFYAPLTFAEHPDGDAVAIGWMSSWTYAAATPTTGWRGAMTLPRRLSLRTVDGRVRLVQVPAPDASALASEPRWTVRDVPLDDAVVPLPRAAGDALLLTAELDVATADEVGLHVRSKDGQRTVVGYDARTGRLFVDRRASGVVDLHPAFPAVHSAPVDVVDGRVRLTVVVDRSSVEVFTQDGLVTITDLVFPDADAQVQEVGVGAPPLPAPLRVAHDVDQRDRVRVHREGRAARVVLGVGEVGAELLEVVEVPLALQPPRPGRRPAAAQGHADAADQRDDQHHDPDQHEQRVAAQHQHHRHRPHRADHGQQRLQARATRGVVRLRRRRDWHVRRLLERPDHAGGSVDEDARHATCPSASADDGSHARASRCDASPDHAALTAVPATTSPRPSIVSCGTVTTLTGSPSSASRATASVRPPVPPTSTSTRTTAGARHPPSRR
ncbi:hypothetical protein HGA02_08295, partial [Cellulomonas septica]